MSSVLAPSSLSLSTTMICSSVKRFRFMGLPPSAIQRWKIPVRNGPDIGGKVNLADRLATTCRRRECLRRLHEGTRDAHSCGLGKRSFHRRQAEVGEDFEDGAAGYPAAADDWGDRRDPTGLAAGGTERNVVGRDA